MLFFGVGGGRRLLSLHGAPPFKIICHHHHSMACHHQRFFFPPRAYFWASLIAQLVKICLQCRRLWFDSWVRKICWRRDRLPTPVFLDLPNPVFPHGSAGKESACNAGDLDLILGLGRSPREGNGYPLQHSCLENSMDRGAWQATGHGVT